MDSRAIVTRDPFVDLMVEALNLIHPRFAGGGGLAYPPDEVDGPAAARKERERPFVMELYHQFRRLWDKAIPVRLGLGHVVTQADPKAPPGRRPDLLFWQLGEHGQPDRRLAAVTAVCLSNAAARDADLDTLARYRAAPGYPTTVCVVIGREADLTPDRPVAPEGVTLLLYDVDRRVAAPIPSPLDHRPHPTGDS